MGGWSVAFYYTRTQVTDTIRRPALGGQRNQPRRATVTRQAMTTRRLQMIVAATGHSGSGILSHVTTIQRINTEGGQPPSAADCNAATLGHQAKIAYTADHYFYAPAK